MSTPSDDFPDLRRLLALKRHEQPPPGFFDDLASEVRHQLRSGSTEDDRVEAVVEQVPWLHKLFQLFQTRPAFAGAFGAVACALVIGGIVYVKLPDANSSRSTPPPTPYMAGTDQQGVGASGSESGVTLTPLTGSDQNGLGPIPVSEEVELASTNSGGLTKPLGGPQNLFDIIDINADTLPASFNRSNTVRRY